MLLVLCVVLLWLGNYLCHHSNNNNIVCTYIENVMVSIKWIYRYTVSLVTPLQRQVCLYIVQVITLPYMYVHVRWLLLNVPYWDTVSSVGYQVLLGSHDSHINLLLLQVMMGIVHVYMTGWEMTSSLWQLLQHCTVYIYKATRQS